MENILQLHEIGLGDLPKVGGENASLGEMITQLGGLGVRIPSGFAIGSNDLTQLTLGLDRDSALVSHLYDERNPAVKRSISHLIQVAHRTGTKVGICGQGPSDYPDFVTFLVREGIDSISVTPDSMLKTLKALAVVEQELNT